MLPKYKKIFLTPPYSIKKCFKEDNQKKKKKKGKGRVYIPLITI